MAQLPVNPAEPPPYMSYKPPPPAYAECVQSYMCLPSIYIQIGNGHMMSAPPLHRSTRKQKLVVSDKKITTEILELIANHIGLGWKALAVQLGVDSSSVHVIDTTTTNGIPAKAFIMLSQWHASNPENATIEHLAKALIRIKRQDVAKLLSIDIQH